MDQETPSLTILGGGVAGLAVAYFGRQRGLSWTLHEAGAEVGGNCRTLSLGPFRFDTGAHRIHDHDPFVTREIRTLLGDSLRRVAAPSHVYRRGQLVSFPLRPLDLARKLGLRTTARAVLDLVTARLGRPSGDDFESVAVRRYGRTIAREFLLDYSQKLWGVPCSRLAPAVAGKRLRGLGLGSFLLEAVRGGGAATTHLDGAFLYPRGGFGAVAERLADAAGREGIRCGSRVTRIVHDGTFVRAVAVEGRAPEPCSAVASTLPLPLLVRALEPAPPARVLELAARLRFRDVVLVALALDRPGVTTSATVYFPDPAIPFNRLYEPRNRCPEMAPEGRTLIVAELPGDAAAGHGESDLCDTVRDTLAGMGWIAAHEVIGTKVTRLPHAYPLLEVGFEAAVREICSHLSGLRNLWLCGRAGRFAYTHLHDVVRQAHEVAEACAQASSPEREAIPA